MEEERFFSENNFLNIINKLEKYENNEHALRNLVIKNSEEHGVLLLSMLLDIAYRKNTFFWFSNIAFLYSFCFHYVEGAQKTALFYFIKAHELNKMDEKTLEAILDFRLPPERILSDEESIFFAKKLLQINSNNDNALRIINSF